MYGTQTLSHKVREYFQFENDVKMYGTQTKQQGISAEYMFENDVKMYGTQTISRYECNIVCLRMM